MAKKLVPDDLWADLAPLFPPSRSYPRGGRPSVGAREALTGILFVLYTGTAWEHLPHEVAGCSGMTCWRRLRSWQDAGLWDRLHHHMLERLHLAGRIDWSRVSVDSSSVAAKRGAMQSAPIPRIVAGWARNAIS